jgi:TetR/AcrR family transcriptional regulator
VPEVSQQVNATQRVHGKKDPDSTRSALLQAGAELFSRHGFGGTKVEAIAARAGVNKAMINYHFRGKEGLYAAILESTLGQVVARLTQIQHEQLPADEQLARIIATFHELARAHPAFPAMMLREVISERTTTSLEALAYPLAVMGIVHEVLVRGIREGVFREISLLPVHLTSIGSLMLFFAAQPVRERLLARAPDRVPLVTEDEYVQQVTQLILRGIAAHPDGKRS